MTKIGHIHLKTEKHRIHHRQREDRVLVSLRPFGVWLWKHQEASMSDLRSGQTGRTATKLCVKDKPSWYLITALVTEKIVIIGNDRRYVYCSDCSVRNHEARDGGI